MQQIRKVLGEIPILASEQRLLEKAEAEAAAAEEAAGHEMTNGAANSQRKATTTTKVLADGTYATETAYSQSTSKDHLESVKNAQKPPLRALILGGDFYTATVLAATLTKLVLRFGELSKEPKAVNALRAEVHFVLHSLRSISADLDLSQTGHAHNDVAHQSWTIAICFCTHRRGLAGTHKYMLAITCGFRAQIRGRKRDSQHVLERYPRSLFQDGGS